MQAMLHADRLAGIIVNAMSRKRPPQRRIMDDGKGPVSLAGWEWNASGNCSAPVLIQLTGRPERAKGFKPYVGKIDLRHANVDRKNMAYFCDVEVRCRRCDRCAAARSAMWRERATFELKRASRTWFATLTVRPEERYRLELNARLVAEARSADGWGGLSDEQRFAATCEQLGRHITLYMKRVRKQAKAKLRYLMVFERHQDGFPHVHMLIHETDLEGAVRKRLLSARDAENPEGQWLLGFSQVKLVRLQGADISKAAFYVSKYISKDARIRIRASIRYGRDNESARPQDIASNKRRVKLMTSNECNANAVTNSVVELPTREPLKGVIAEVERLFSPHGSGKAFKPRLKSRIDHWFHPEPGD